MIENRYQNIGLVPEIKGRLLTDIAMAVGVLRPEQVEAIIPNVRFALQRAFEVGHQDTQEIDGTNHESERQGE